MIEYRNPYCFKVLLLLAISLVLVGCDDEEKRKAIEDAERSRKSLNRIEAKLTRAQKEIADLEELLNSVTEQRDALEVRVKGLLEDQGKAAATSQDKQRAIGDVIDSLATQTENVSVLQSQVVELTSTIRLQEETISEYEGLVAELLKTIELQQQSIAEEYTGQKEELQDINEP